MHQVEAQREAGSQGLIAVESRITDLAKKIQGVDAMETELAGWKLRGLVSSVAFERQGALLRAERTYYEDAMSRQRATLETIRETDQATDGLMALRDRIQARLEAGSFGSPESFTSQGYRRGRKGSRDQLRYSQAYDELCTTAQGR